MTILRSGSNQKYSQNWAAAFGAPESDKSEKKAGKKKTAAKAKKTTKKAAKKARK